MTKSFRFIITIITYSIRPQIILNLLFFGVSSLIWPQQYNFTNYGVEDGLFLSEISTLHQGKDGFIYIGTYGGGISIFDGTNFKNFTSANGLINNVVNAIEEDEFGRLFIGTDKGLSVLNGNHIINFQSNNSAHRNRIYALKRDSDNKIWIGTENGLCLAGKDSIIKISLPDFDNRRHIYSLLIDKNQNLLIGTERGLFVLDNLKKKISKFHSVLKNDRINRIFRSSDDAIWVATNRGAFRFLGEDYTLFSSVNGLPNNLIWNFAEDVNGAIWIATEEGLSVFKNKNLKTYKIENGLKSNVVWALLVDKEDNVWAGTDLGLNLLTHRQFKNYKSYKNRIIETWSIYEDKQGIFWFGLDKQGVILYDGKTFYEDPKLKRIEKYSVWSILEDDKNNLWFGIDSGVVKYNRRSVLFFNERNGFTGDAVMTMKQDSKGDLWIGTYRQGIFRFDGKRFTRIRNINGKSNSSVYSFYEDRKGNLWIGTYEGIILYSDGELSIPDELKELSTYSIMDIFGDDYGDLWLASYEAGLFRCKYEQESVRIVDTINVQKGLNENSILAVTTDQKGNLWIGTNVGLNKFDLNEYHLSGKVNIVSYSKNDGIPGRECNQGAAFCDSENNIWFGTSIGLVTCNSEEITNNTIAPRVYISDFQVFFEDISELPGMGYLNNKPEMPHDIKLNYDQNYISIIYHGLSYTNALDVKYRYQLNRSDWSPATKENSVTFPNLPPGNYSFKVIAQNSDGICSENAAEYSFVILSPLWKRPWFVAIAVILLTFIIYAWYKYRLTIIQVQKQNLEKIVDERLEYEKQLEKSEEELIKAKEAAEKSDRLKSEFLAQMSHEIRTPINTMMSFISLIEENVKDMIDEELRDSFQIIKNGGKRLTNTIDSILNMSQIQIGTFETRPEKLNLFTILNNLHVEFKPYAKTKNLQLNLKRDCNNDSFIGDYYTVTQIFANLIDNAIKYTKKGQIDVILYHNGNGTLCVDVKDTGIGITPEFQKNLFNPFSQEETGYTRRYEGNGLGLALVKNYCTLNNAEITIQSAKGEGSKFTVQFPVNNS